MFRNDTLGQDNVAILNCGLIIIYFL